MLITHYIVRTFIAIEISLIKFIMKDLILKGPPSNARKIEKGIGEFFFEQADNYGDNIFQIDGENGKSETYSVVRQRSTRVAIYLQDNIKPKDIVMICCQNNTDNIIPALAAFYLGAYVASIDPKQTVSDIRQAIELVEPRVIFVQEQFLQQVENSLKGSNIYPDIIVIGNSEKYVKMIDLESQNKGEVKFKPVKQKSSDTAAILFSSGTTSAPKGICISNSYILNSCWRLIEHNQTKLGVILHFSSLYWISAWIMTGMVISTGTAKLVAPNITAEKFLQFVEKYKITYVFTSNTYTYELTNLPNEVIGKYDTSSLYSICIGGSTMDPQQLLRLRKLLPYTNVALGYGSTEGNFMVCHDFTNQKGYEEKISSSGTVVPETELKFVDLETGKLAGPNQSGEIRCKSPYMMTQYHNYKNSDCFDEDGFLKVGDIGYYDEDQYVYITDRLSEMFKYKTNQISPSVLEHILLTHPAIAEAVVFGVPHPIDRNHPAACVVLKNGTKPRVQELLDFTNSKISDAFKLRGGLMIVDSVPKTPTGKPQKRIIRDLYMKINKF